MTFSNLSVAALAQHLPEVLALPPYDPSAPKAAPVAAPARTELERLDDALKMFREACPSLRVADLQGDAHARNRAAILSALEGRRVPQSKSGFNAVRAALFAAAHVDTEGSLAERTAQFENFALLYLNPPTAEEVAEGVADMERELAEAPPLANFVSEADEPACGCEGAGWAVFNEDTEDPTVQRCDDCQIFETDEDAWEAATAAGVEHLEGHVLRSPVAAALMKSEIEPTASAPTARPEVTDAPHIAPTTCATVLSDEQGHVIIRYRSPQGAEGDCMIQVSPGGLVDVFMSTAPKPPTYSTEKLPVGDLDTLTLILLSEGGRVPEELCFSTERAEGEVLLPPDAPKAKAAKAPAEPKAPKAAKPSAEEERARVKAERAARTASRAAARKGKGKK